MISYTIESLENFGFPRKKEGKEMEEEIKKKRDVCVDLLFT